jgi:glucose uptake protein
MILPGSYLFSLILLALSLLCWGSWANTLKMAGPKWRFELYCYDFAIGLVAAALLISFTFGSLGLDGFTVVDDLRLAGKRQDAFALVAGGIFTLGNMLLIAVISLAGMSVALPVGLGSALIFGAILGHFLNPSGSGVLVAAGCIAVLGGAVFSAVAYKKYQALKFAEGQAAAAAAAALAAEEALAQNKPLPAKKKALRKKPITGKVIFLSVLAGLFLGAFYPLLDLVREGENGLGPYSAALVFGVGVLSSTIVYNLFFMNLPLHGSPIDFSQYFTGKGSDHLLGMLGGAILFVGLTAGLVVARAEGAAQVGPALSSGIVKGAMVLGAIEGFVVWKEFKGAEGSIKLYLGVMLVLLALGIGVVSVAPLYGAG